MDTSLTGFYTPPGSNALGTDLNQTVPGISSEPAKAKPKDLSQEDVLKAYEQEESLKRQKEIGTAENEAKAKREFADLNASFAEQVANWPELQQIKELEGTRQKAFIPTQESAGDLGLLFTLTNLVGFAIGGKTKGNAQAAMSAMNGMLEGHHKGRDDVYKREKDAFEENQKAIDKTLASLRAGFQDGLKLLATNREAGKAKIEATLAENNATTVKDLYNKLGAVTAAKVVENMYNTQEKNKKAREKEQGTLVPFTKPDGTVVLMNNKTGEIKESPELTGASKLGTKPKAAAGEGGTTATRDTESNYVDAIANYSIKAPGLRDKKRPEIMAKVLQKNPDYRESDFGDRDIAYRNWTSPNGAGAKQIQAFNTVANHLEAISELGKALNNNDARALNSVSNYFDRELGYPNVTNFEAAKQVVSGEIVKAITGTSGALRDREEAQRIFNSASSPAQLEGAIKSIRTLIQGRLDVARNLYETGTGRKNFDSFLSPAAKTEFSGGGQAPAAAPAQSYKDPEDVKAAYKSGKITREQAVDILKKDFGHQ